MATCKHCGNEIEVRDDETLQRQLVPSSGEHCGWAEVDDGGEPVWDDDRDFQCGGNVTDGNGQHEPDVSNFYTASDDELAAVDVAALSDRSVGDEPVTVDWTGDPEMFYDRLTLAWGEECPRCGEAVAAGSGEITCEVCEHEWEPDDPDAGVPMMTYAYPADHVDSEQAAALAHLPLTIVSAEDFPGLPDGTYLALTGGGMDFSWEICEAYVRLGCLPPAHFCDLPGMAGYPQSRGQVRVIEVCERSLRIMAERYRMRALGTDSSADRMARLRAEARLSEIRATLRAERISYGELAELQSLAPYIAPDDVELLEAAGVAEHDDEAGQ